MIFWKETQIKLIIDTLNLSLVGASWLNWNNTKVILIIIVKSNISFFQFWDSNIRLFSIAHCIIVVIYLLWFIFGIHYLTLFLIAPTIAIVIVFAFKDNSIKFFFDFCYCLVERGSSKSNWTNLYLKSKIMNRKL